MTQHNDNGHRAGPKLDIRDMERRMVEFRLTLDREKRRFQCAHMTDQYEKLLRDKLAELRRLHSNRAHTQDQTQAEGGNQRDDQQRAAQEAPGDTSTNPDNEIKLTCLDKEGSGRLRNFLTYTIEMCKRIEQQELMQEVLRGALLDTRRKRFKTQQEQPGVELEPFCLFCAADLKAVTLASECQNVLHRQPQQDGTQVAPVASMAIANTGDNLNRDSSLPRVEVVQQETPPPSTVPTPEVGEQSGIYTPNAGGRNSSSSPPAAAAASTCLAPKEMILKSRIVDKKIKTNASAPSSASKEASGQQQVVLPSDEDESSSDDQNRSSMRNVIDWANRSRSPLKKVIVDRARGASAATAADETTDERRCSTPLSGDPERSLPQLVIGEADQRTCSSPIPRLSKSIKGGKSINTTFTAPPEVKPELQQQHGAGLSITHSMETSVASRLDESSQQQQQSAKGVGTIRKKFKPRRRNKNN